MCQKLCPIEMFPLHRSLSGKEVGAARVEEAGDEEARERSGVEG